MSLPGENFGREKEVEKIDEESAWLELSDNVTVFC